MRSHSGLHTIFDSKAADGVGLVFFSSDYSKVELNLDTIADTDGTIKFYVSDAEFNPDFSAAQDEDNAFYPAQVVDIEDMTPIDGDTGITPAGIVHKKLILNVNGARWVNAIISGMSSGAYTLKCRGYNEP